MRHKEQHPLAGKTVRLALKKDGPNVKSGDAFRIEDWWDRIVGKSWGVCDGNPACLHYAMRSGFGGLPPDDEVVYGKVGAYGHLIHASELGEESGDAPLQDEGG